MAFGPKSTNPRERRAYAHAKIAEARESGDLRNFRAAQMAVRRVGDSRKSVMSGFEGAIRGAILADDATRVIAEKAKIVLDPEATPPYGETHLDEERYLSYAGFESPDFSRGYRQGASITRIEEVEPWLANLAIDHISLNFRDFDADGQLHVVPLAANCREVDALRVRTMPDGLRQMLAGIAERAEVLLPRMDLVD
jgi:hypothetical protein